DEEGSETYRVRYLLSRLNTPELDLKLPAPLAGLFLDVRISEPRRELTRVTWTAPDTSGLIARLPNLQNLMGKELLLEIRYRRARGRPESEGVCQTILPPPELLGNVFLGHVRWQVTLPPRWMPITVEGNAVVEQHLGLRGWLVGPVPDHGSAELERW